MAKLNCVKSLPRRASWSRIRISQISCIFSGAFWPINLPLFYAALRGRKYLYRFMTNSISNREGPDAHAVNPIDQSGNSSG